MNHWERRLSDLAHALTLCHSTYLEPDLFRRNTNQFLLTARTVTFLIQKHKASIPDFDVWYSSTVREPWSNDEVMGWAKDSRNVVEKEGDLEMFSSLQARLIFSYVPEQDALISTGRSELLNGGIKQLLGIARAQLPSGMRADAVIKIERRWVTSSLKDWELVHALTYVYARLHAVCDDLATKLGGDLSSTIPGVASFERLRDNTQRIAYLKLSSLKEHTITVETRHIRKSDEVSDKLKRVIAGLAIEKAAVTSIDGACNYVANMAEAIFLHFGNHVPMLILFDQTWTPISIISANFDDQSDKYIFWRRIAESVETLRAHALGWVSESWRRTLEGYPQLAINDLPIVGEELQVFAMDKSGAERHVEWDIERKSPGGTPCLKRRAEGEVAFGSINYLLPIRRAWGLPDGDIL